MAKDRWPDWDIYLRDRCVCVYCGFVGRDKLSWRQLEIDHLIPRTKGGTDTPDNKVVSCKACNLLKSSFDPRTSSVSFPLSPADRSSLITNVQKYLQSKRSLSDEDTDFNQMMKELDNI